MDLGLKNKVAIVTGSSEGSGKAIALGLAREGVKVTINSCRKEVLEHTAQEIQTETGSEVLQVPADVTDPETGKKLVLSTVEKFNAVHILVNNAGGPPSGHFEDFQLEDFLESFELNFMSGIRITKAVLPVMKKQRWGRIINSVSAGLKLANPNLVLSSVARFGVAGWSKNLANDVAPYNILVNMVVPGFMLTKRLEEVINQRAEREGKTPEDIKEGMSKMVPLGRIGSPEDYADAVVFLASEAASYITGATLQIEGGRINTLI